MVVDCGQPRLLRYTSRNRNGADKPILDATATRKAVREKVRNKTAIRFLKKKRFREISDSAIIMISTTYDLRAKPLVSHGATFFVGFVGGPKRNEAAASG
jgi:hypothetical protein